jgi:hypothetical protein
VCIFDINVKGPTDVDAAVFQTVLNMVLICLCEAIGGSCVCVCVCVCRRERERESERAKESACVCVCVCVCALKQTVVPGFALPENTCVYEQVLQKLVYIYRADAAVLQLCCGCCMLTLRPEALVA